MTLTKRERRILSGGDRRSFLARALPLSPIGDIAGATLSEVTAETITWSTSTDWNNAVDESYVSHSSDIINMTPGVDSFEDLSNGASIPSSWNPDSGSITSSYSSDGSLSADNDGSTGSDYDPIMSSTVPNHAPTEITFAWRETSSSGGISYWVEDASGNIIVEMGSGNTQTGFRSGSSGYYCMYNDLDPQYQEWRRFTVTFDWANEQFDILFEDLTGSTSDASRTGESFVNSASEIGAVYMGNINNVWCSAGGTGSFGDEWVDEVYGVYRTSDLTTATKSFSSTVSPDLQNLIYTLNGETIVLDVIGSPGTASEEIVSQTLDGAAGYTLTWSNTHSDFRIKTNLSTSARDGSSLPTVDQLELIA